MMLVRSFVRRQFARGSSVPSAGRDLLQRVSSQWYQSRYFAKSSAPETTTRNAEWYKWELNKCLRMKWYDQGLKVWDQMRADGIEADAVLYNTMFRMHLDARNYEAADALLKEAGAQAAAKGKTIPLIEAVDQLQTLTKDMVREDIQKGYDLYQRFIAMQNAGLNPFQPK